MSCLLAEILPSSDNTIEVLTDVESDTETVFRLRNSDVATLSLPDCFDADVKPFRLIIVGKKHATSTSTTGQMRLVLGDSDDLGSDINVSIFAGMSGSLESQFYYTADCIWNSASQKLVLMETTIVGTTVTGPTSNPISSIASQSDIKFSLFGKFTSTGFDSSDSLTVLQFKLVEI